MNTLNKGIDYTIEVSDLDTSRNYTATLRNAATSESYSISGFFMADKCYFYFPKSLTTTFSVGVYQLNVYDENRTDMLFNDTYCKVRETGLEG